MEVVTFSFPFSSEEGEEADNKIRPLYRRFLCCSILANGATPSNAIKTVSNGRI